ncbi:MAG: MipA/OmpV family protein [Sideroxydans sp.]|nr:MipA/OmpV family protein [Sideroxydans sp.]
MLCITSAQAEEFPQKLEGDVGAGAYYTGSTIVSKSGAVSVLPYGDFKYGRAFARVDTLGIKTVKMGYGYLEVAGRVSMDGFSADTPVLQGLHDRVMPVPLGLGTLQITPVGGFYINAFHDVRQSKGNRVEMLWGGKVELPRVTLYPLLGAEYFSQEYVRYYYGISPQEAAASLYAAYQPGGAYNGFIALIIDVELTPEYHLNAYLRHKRLGDAIQQSPIVTRRYLDTGYLALSYRFK